MAVGHLWAVGVMRALRGSTRTSYETLSLSHSRTPAVPRSTLALIRSTGVFSMLVPTTFAVRIQMRRVHSSLLAAVITLLPALAAAQGAAQAGDASKAVAGGGIMAAGWKAVMDPKEAGAGATAEQAKLVKE